MKNFFATALVIIIMIISLAGCAGKTSKTSTTADPTDTTATTEEEEIIVTSLTYEGNLDKLLLDYREEVENRLSSGKDFDYSQIVEDDWYYPVAVAFEDDFGNEGIAFLYTSQYGQVYIDSDNYLVRNALSTNVLGSLHIDDIYMNVIESNTKWALYHSEVDNELVLFQFGEKVTSIPVTGYYCGKSKQVGHLFKDGCVVDTYNVSNLTLKKETIADNVDYVIDANYAQGSDPWSVPIFLMEDGSLKVYVPWEDELQKPRFEGGWH